MLFAAAAAAQYCFVAYTEDHAKVAIGPMRRRGLQHTCVVLNEPDSSYSAADTDPAGAEVGAPTTSLDGSSAVVAPSRVADSGDSVDDDDDRYSG